jgi:uncharacterized membrane protein
MIDSHPFGYAGLLAAMVMGAYGMRTAGFWLIGYIRIGPRLERMLNALPGAVIAASVVPVVAKGGLSAVLAVVASMVTMTVVRSNFAAVVAGVGVAALARAAGL